MTKEQLETIAEAVAEARRLNARMAEVLDALDAALGEQAPAADLIQEADSA